MAIAVLCTVVVVASQPSKEIAWCDTILPRVNDLALPNGGGFSNAENLNASPSIYTSAWKTRIAAITHNDDLVPDPKALKVHFLTAIRDPSKVDSDPGLDELEIVATAVSGLSSLSPTPGERRVALAAVEALRDGPKYRTSSAGEASSYGTYLAAQSIHALHGDAPEVVIEALRGEIAGLPSAPTLADLDERTIPVLGALSLLGAHVPTTPSDVSVWYSTISAVPPDGLTLSLTAAAHLIATSAGIPAKPPTEHFDPLLTAGGVSVGIGDVADPKATYYATLIGIEPDGLREYLRHGRGLAGWLPFVSKPTTSTTFAGVMANRLCGAQPPDVSALVSSALHQLEAQDSLTIVESGQICALTQDREVRRGLAAALDEAARSAQKQTVGESDAAALVAAGQLCGSAIEPSKLMTDRGSAGLDHEFNRTILGDTPIPTVAPLRDNDTETLAGGAQRAWLTDKDHDSRTVLRSFECGGTWCASRTGENGNRSDVVSISHLTFVLAGSTPGDRESGAVIILLRDV